MTVEHNIKYNSKANSDTVLLSSEKGRRPQGGNFIQLRLHT